MTDTFLGISEVCPELHASPEQIGINDNFLGVYTAKTIAITLHRVTVTACPCVHVSACPRVRKSVDYWKEKLIEINNPISWSTISSGAIAVRPRPTRLLPEQIAVNDNFLGVHSNFCDFILFYITSRYCDRMSVCPRVRVFGYSYKNGYVFGYLACKSMARVTQLYFYNHKFIWNTVRTLRTVLILCKNTVGVKCVSTEPKV